MGCALFAHTQSIFEKAMCILCTFQIPPSGATVITSDTEQQFARAKQRERTGCYIPSKKRSSTTTTRLEDMSTSPLHIFVQNKHVGTLHQNSLNDYRLQYVDGVTDNDCISVTMLPSQASSWHFRELPPVLLTSMPEGGVRKRISQRFARSVSMTLHHR